MTGLSVPTAITISTGNSTDLSSNERSARLGRENTPSWISSILPTAPAFSPVMISAVAPFSKTIWLVILLTAGRLTTQLSPTFRFWSLMSVLLSWKPYCIFLPLILVLLVILISFNPFSASSIAIGDNETPFLGTILYA